MFISNGPIHMDKTKSADFSVEIKAGYVPHLHKRFPMRIG